MHLIDLLLQLHRSKVFDTLSLGGDAVSWPHPTASIPPEAGFKASHYRLLLGLPSRQGVKRPLDTSTTVHSRSMWPRKAYLPLQHITKMAICILQCWTSSSLGSTLSLRLVSSFSFLFHFPSRPLFGGLLVLCFLLCKFPVP